MSCSSLASSDAVSGLSKVQGLEPSASLSRLEKVALWSEARSALLSAYSKEIGGPLLEEEKQV